MEKKWRQAKCKRGLGPGLNQRRFSLFARVFSRAHAYVCAAVFIAVLAPAQPVFAVEFPETLYPWELELVEDGVTVYTRRLPDRPVVQVKGTIMVQKSVEELVRLWSNVDNYVRWMYQCRDSRTLETIDENSLIVYIVTASPWPLADRDNILRATMERHRTGEVYIDLQAQPDYLQPQEGIVRVRDSFGAVRMIPAGRPGGPPPDQKGWVLVEFEFYYDPLGQIPTSIINLFIDEFPYTTMYQMGLILEDPAFQGNLKHQQ